MKYEIKWLPEAKQDVADIASYITSSFGAGAVEKMLDGVDEVASLLAYTPYMGEAFGTSINYRVFHSKRNSLYYRINDNEVVIVVVMDSRRGPDTIASLLKKRNQSIKQ